MPLSDIVSVTITAATKGISQAGFGTPLFAGFHTAFLDLVRTYSDPSELVPDGILTTDPIYKMAAAAWAQNPHPDQFKVGRRDTAFTQTIELEVKDATVGRVYSLVVVSPDGTSTTVTYTVVTLDTTTDVAVALAALITAIADVTVPVPGTAVLTATADNDGELFFYNELNAELELTDITADPGITADLTEIKLFDADWYGLAIDSQSEAEIKSAVAFIETQSKIAAFNTADAGVKDTAVSDDVASDLQGTAEVRSALIYSADHDGYAGAAWLGEMLPTTPGSATWAFKTLEGVAVDNLNVTEQGAVEGKNCNHYLTINARNITRNGISPGGEFMDTIRGIDWTEARMQEAVFLVLANSPKVPFTDSGVDTVRNQMESVLDQGVENGFLAADPKPFVTAPLVANVSAANKAGRILPDMHFEGVLAGAVHKVIITGTISV